MTEIAIDIETNTCSRCGEVKPVNEFYINGPSKGGRMGICRACTLASRRVTPTKVIRNRATMRALRALADQHRDEYERLLAEETVKAAAEHEALTAAAAARGNADAEVARIKPGPKSQDRGETSTLDRLDVARCPSCHQHHDAGHLCPTCGDDTTEVPGGKRPRDLDVDEVVVERRMTGDKAVQMNRGERLEVVRRLHARGLSDGEIHQRTGIHKDQAYRDRKTLGLPGHAQGGAA